MKHQVWLWLLLLTLLAGCTAPAAPVAEPLLILWHSFNGAERQALQSISDAFNADNPWGLHLVVEYQDQIFEKVAAATPEQRPDLVVVWPEMMDIYRQAGLSADLTPLPPGLHFDTDDLLPMARALFSTQGELQGIPLGLSTYLIYYNADWLSDLGYNQQSPTWEDLRRAACAASDPLKEQVGLGLPTSAGALMAQLAASGAQLSDAEGNYTLFKPETLIAAANLHFLLADRCAGQYILAAEGVNQLNDHQIAMLIDSSQRLMEIEQQRIQGRRFSLSLGPVPAIDGPGPTLWYGPGLLLLAPEGPRRQAALQAMNWFISPEAQQIWRTTTQQLPVRRTLLETYLQDNTDHTTGENALFALTLEAADTGQWAIWPNHPNAAGCRAALLEGMFHMGQTTAPEALLITIQAQCKGVEP